MPSSTRWPELDRPAPPARPYWRSRRHRRDDGRVLTIRLFGTPEIIDDGRPIVLASARAHSLLAYLVLRAGIAQRRDHLAFQLWPDSTDQQARTNLRHVLHTLRTVLPDADRYLEVTPQTLAWRGGSADVTAFEQHLAAAAAPDTADPVPALRAAVDLYTGELLAGWYDDWVEPDRDRLRNEALDALNRLVTHLRADGTPVSLDAAIGYAERARAMDPLAEPVYRTLMTLYTARGDRARALRVYHEGVAVLQERLGVPPSAETRAAYAALLPKTDTTTARTVSIPFVGRHRERRRLRELWQTAQAGRAQLAFVSGEPGVGKTRLVEELRRWTARQGAATAAARSYPAEGALPYAPVISWLRAPDIARWRARLEPGQRAQLARLLPEAAAQAAPDDPQARLPLFDAAARALLAGPAPVLLVADDLPAADAQTLQFLHFLLRAEPKAPLLIAATGRLAETDADDPVHELLSGVQVLGLGAHVELSRFDSVDTTQLAQRLAGRTLATDELAWLHDQTAGNPLFIVETLRGEWPDGERPDVLTPRAHAVLETRLRRLSAGARELAGLAAAVGSSIPVDLLITAGPRHDPDEVGRDLDELWRRQVLLATGPATYDFSHDKLREVAYAALTPAQRRAHHLALAQALQDLRAGHPDDVAGQVAAHLHAAGADARAVDWYVRAARAARRVHADADAAHLLDQALTAVRSAPVSRDRHRRELDLLAAAMGPLAAAEGYASPRLAAALTAALELARGLGEPPSPPLLRAQGMAVLCRGDFDAALEIGGELRARGAAAADPAERDLLVVEGAFVQGVAAYWRGELADADEHLSIVTARYRPANRGAHLLSFAQDPYVLAVARLAHVQFFNGDHAAARRLQRESLELAEAVGHPFTRGVALLFAGLLDVEMGEPDALRRRVAELAELRSRLDFPAIRLVAEALLGYLEVVDGRPAAGYARIDATRADPGSRTAPGMPEILLRIELAACLHAGDHDRAAGIARRLLAGDVRVWDEQARRILTH